VQQVLVEGCPASVFGVSGKGCAGIDEHQERSGLGEREDRLARLAAEDDPIAALCDRLHVKRFRGDGDPNDVLERLCQAARTHGADVVVRLTGDCPLLDPAKIDEMVTLYERERPDYVRHCPDGFDVEVLSRSLLGRVRSALTRCDPTRRSYFREHPTSYIFDGPEPFVVMTVGAVGPPLSVDTPADLEHVRHIYQTLGETFSMEEAQACKPKRTVARSR